MMEERGKSTLFFSLTVYTYKYRVHCMYFVLLLVYSVDRRRAFQMILVEEVTTRLAGSVE